MVALFKNKMKSPWGKCRSWLFFRKMIVWKKNSIRTWNKWEMCSSEFQKIPHSWQKLYNSIKKNLVISIVWLDAKMSVLLSFLLSKLCTKMRSFQDNDDFVWKKKKYRANIVTECRFMCFEMNLIDGRFFVFIQHRPFTFCRRENCFYWNWLWLVRDFADKPLSNSIVSASASSFHYSFSYTTFHLINWDFCSIFLIGLSERYEGLIHCKISLWFEASLLLTFSMGNLITLKVVKYFTKEQRLSLHLKKKQTCSHTN